MSSLYFKSNQTVFKKEEINNGYIDKCIYQLEAELVKPMSDYHITKELWQKVFSIIPVLTNCIDPTCTILRCRPNDNDEQIFKHVNEISYIKKEEQVKAGRFNRDKNPVFYGAIVPEKKPTAKQLATTILEVAEGFATLGGVDAHKYLTVGLWRPDKGARVINLLFDNADDFLSNSQKYYPEEYNRLCQSYNTSSLKKIAEVYRFVGKYASAQASIDSANIHNIYILNTAFYDACQNIYKEKVRYLGLLHKSSKTKEANLVLPPSALIDKAIVPVSVAMYKWIKQPLSEAHGKIHRCSNNAEVDTCGNFELKKITFEELESQLSGI